MCNEARAKAFIPCERKSNEGKSVRAKHLARAEQKKPTIALFAAKQKNGLRLFIDCNLLTLSEKSDVLKKQNKKRDDVIHQTTAPARFGTFIEG